MQQDSKEPSMQLTNKCLKVKCQKHMKPIIGLNIGLNQSLDNRIICDECPNIDQKIISLDFAEKCLQNWHQEEEEQIIGELEDFEGFIKYFKEFCLYFLTTEMRMEIEKIETKHREYKKTLKSPQQSKISQFFNTITCQEIISEEYLSNLALFFSQQIIKDHQIYLKEQTLHYFQDDYLILTNINKTIGKKITIGLDSNPFNEFSQDQQFKSVEKNNNLNNLTVDFRYTQYSLLCGCCHFYAFSYDNKFLATPSRKSCYITIWNFEEQTKIKQLKSPNSVRLLEFSQNSRFLAVGQGNKNEDSSIVIFDLTSDFRWPIIRIPELHFNSRKRSGIRFTKDSNYLICQFLDTLKIWDIKQQTEVYSRKFSSLIKDFLICDNLDLIVCGCLCGDVYLFKSKTLPKLQIVGHWKACRFLEWFTITPNSESIITISDFKVKIWSTKSLGKQIKTFSVKDDVNGDYGGHVIVLIRSITLNGQILILQYEHHISIWHIETSQLLTKIKIYGSEFWNGYMSITSDMRYIIVKDTNEYSVLKIYKRIE